ncbi:hypothetical protein VTK73DRAFT_7201 [Phialemonium thermophilum]|uniref:G-protein coupled receptors family 2 profile 2 domain-containing protein n=1 Tax=Phialemonium thermophilum TaxID=223376 RepID=A0ABR3WG45_9PEZI
MDDLPHASLPRPLSPSEVDFMNLTVEQRSALQTVERVGAALSLAGVTLIFVTFAAFKRLRTVPNTFILFASVANVGASIACLIGYSGLKAGDGSALCQVQGFLLEMFMQADPWWSLAMAINVYMVFFMAANPNSFRQYLWLYCLICFGAPATPALVCLVIRKSPRGLIYGNATLWCWIDDDWNSLRIFTYYMPIWICILLSGVIYFAVGYQVFHQRNQLRNLTLSNPGKDVSSWDIRDSGEKSLANQPGCYGTVTTEVQVTSEGSDAPTCPPSPTTSIAPVVPRSPPKAHQHVHPWADRPDSPTEGYLRDEHCLHRSPSVGGVAPGFPPMFPSIPFTTISSVSCSCAPLPSAQRRQGVGQGRRCQTSAGATGASSTTTVATATSQRHHHYNPADAVSTHQPSSQNPLLLVVALVAPLRRFRRAAARFAGKMRNMDPVKMAYLRTSFVFAISVLVTWTPSSINRVYTLAYPRRFNFALNMASAVVLPLQGVWNAVIYCATSWVALRGETLAAWEDVASRCGLGWMVRSSGDRRGSGGSGSGSGGGGGGMTGRDPQFGTEGRRDRRLGRDWFENMELAPRAGTVRVFRGGSL